MNAVYEGFPGGSDSKASVYNAGDQGSIPGWQDALEKEMAIHSRTIAWKIPWTEEPGRLQSMGSQRVGHDWATSLYTISTLMAESEEELKSFLMKVKEESEKVGFKTQHSEN